MVEEKKLIPKRRFKAFQNADAWEQCELGDILQYEQPTKYIVKTTEYDDKYTTPVLTAGQSFILGYTDESSDIKDANAESPVIIFDDFTTSSQYVDFPFKVKSSAMKLLELKDDSNDFYFAANVLKNIDYIPQGHERHWISKFSKLDVLMPTVEEQRLIGGYFKKLDNLITLHQRKLEKIKSMKKAYLYEMFPTEGENRPKRRFKGFTDDWEQCKFKDVSDIVRGASPRPIKDPKWFDEVSEVGWLRISDVTEQDGRIKFLEQRISEAGQEKTRVLYEPHLLLSIAATVGKPVINYVETGVHDGFLIFLNPKFDQEFMFQWFEMFRPKWQEFGQPGSQVNLNSDLVKNTKIMLPNRAEQGKIGDFLKSIDNLITLHQRKLDKLQNLKKAYLNEMFV